MKRRQGVAACLGGVILSAIVQGESLGQTTPAGGRGLAGALNPPMASTGAPRGGGGMWVPYPAAWSAPRAAASLPSSARIVVPVPRPASAPYRAYLPETTPRVAVPPPYAAFALPAAAGDAVPSGLPASPYYFGTYGYSPYYYAPTQPSYAAYAPPGVPSGTGTPAYQVRYNDLPGRPILSQGGPGSPGFTTPGTFAYPSYTNDRAFYGQGLNVLNVPGQISYGQSTQSTLTPPGYFGNILPTNP